MLILSFSCLRKVSISVPPTSVMINGFEIFESSKQHKIWGIANNKTSPPINSNKNNQNNQNHKNIVGSVKNNVSLVVNRDTNRDKVNSRESIMNEINRIKENNEANRSHLTGSNSSDILEVINGSNNSSSGSSSGVSASGSNNNSSSGNDSSGTNDVSNDNNSSSSSVTSSSSHQVPHRSDVMESPTHHEGQKS